MLLVGAIALAVFVLDPPWATVVVAGGALAEVAEAWLWYRWSRRRQPHTGREALIGARAEVVAPCRPVGRVRIAGELWKARCEEGADVGETVRVRAVEGLVLFVDREAGAYDPGR